MSLPLRQWVQRHQHHLVAQNQDSNQQALKKQALLKITTVAFGITHLVRRIYQNNLASTPQEWENICKLDNFMVRVSDPSSAEAGASTWMDIEGLDMMLPMLSLQFLKPDSLNTGGGSTICGKNLDVQIHSLFQSENVASLNSDRVCCHRLGVLFYELFANMQPRLSAGVQDLGVSNDGSGEPAQKRRASQPINSPYANNSQISSATSISDSQTGGMMPRTIPLLEFGLPSSINLLVGNLLKIGFDHDQSNLSNTSLKSVCKDLHVLILEPHLFLFDRDAPSSGNTRIQFSEEKTYGREKESSAITDAFSRVSGDGKSEALLIGGAPGSGKTKLVESLIPQVEAVGGVVVQNKICLMEKESFSTVISTFNDLILQIKNRLSPSEAQDLVVRLMDEFYSDFFLLAQLLPNIYLLCPQLRSTYESVDNETQMSLGSISFILQRFMKIVATKEHPTMFFLDDLQWSDKDSLELLLSILTDDFVSNFFFVGNYRSNEVEIDHEIFDTIDTLKASGVVVTKLHLEGLNEEAVNAMCSDALCVLPSFCRPLSDFLCQRTKGNPLFSRQTLQSLVDRKLVQYSLRERRWDWNIHSIASENVVTKDIAGLLLSKMKQLPDETQSALKVVSCFGTKISVALAQKLSSTPQHSNLVHCLDQLVANGYMTKSPDEYKVIHDVVSEVAYHLIATNEKELYHFNLALSLYSVSEGQDLDSMILFICDQFKKSRNFFNKAISIGIDLVGLFVKAGKKALEQSELPRARNYLITGESQLPENKWSACYDTCIQLYALFAKACYSCGMINEAKNCLQQILDMGRSLEDKLDAHYLMASIQFNTREVEDAYNMCCTVISELHEPIPESVNPGKALIEVQNTSNLLNRMTDSQLLGLKDADARSSSILKFYSLLITLCYVMKRPNFPSLACKMIKLNISMGVSTFSVMGFSQYAGLLSSSKTFLDIPTAKRAGQLAMSFQKRFVLSEQMPVMVIGYYGFAGAYAEPFQNCADMHLRGFDMSMSLGISTFAFSNPLFYIRSAFFAGENLPELLKRTVHFSGLARKFGHLHQAEFIEFYRDTIEVLLGKAKSSERQDLSEMSPIQVMHYNFHESIRSFWLRHHERFEHFYEKNTSNQGVSDNMINRHMLKFMYGLNSFQYRKDQHARKKVSIGHECKKEMKQLAVYSDWNFKMKFKMLEAEIFSTTKRNDKAEASYLAAIESAHNSKFVHEEGLACELAGFHFLGLGEKDKAQSQFNQAKECYTVWGSQLKVDFVAEQIAKVMM